MGYGCIDQCMIMASCTAFDQCIRAGASCVAGRPDMDPVYLFQFLVVSDHRKLLHIVKRSAFYSENHFIKTI
jgi:hypothetical protein